MRELLRRIRIRGFYLLLGFQPESTQERQRFEMLRRQRELAEAPPLGAPIIPMLDLAGLRIALSGRALAAIQEALESPGEKAYGAKTRTVISAVWKQRQAWLFTSLESTPRRDAPQIESARKRLMEDAARRFPAASDVHNQDGNDPFRSGSFGDSVFVVSIVFTCAGEITAHAEESHHDTMALMKQLHTLAERPHTFDVFVSGLFSIDELSRRDPAMRGIA